MNKLLLLSWSLFKGSCDMVSMKQGYFPYSRLFRTLPAWYYFWILFLKTPTTSWLKITAIIWEASTSLSFYIHVHTHTNIHIKNYKDYSLTAPQKKKKRITILPSSIIILIIILSKRSGNILHTKFAYECW